MATVIKAGNVASGAQVTPDATGILQFNTGSGAGTAAMTIDASQNVTFAQTATFTQGANLPNTFGFKNRIINGAMSFWQRGTSFTNPTTTNFYTADRWGVNRNSDVAGATVSRSTDVPAGFQYSLRLQRTAGNTSTAGIYLFNSNETVNTLDLAGQQVTLSFWVKAGANYSGGTLTVNANWGTGTDQRVYAYTGSTTFISAAQAITTTWTRYSFTGTVGASSTEVGFIVFYDPTGTAGADDSIYITGVQLEKGSTATSFDYRPYGTELSLCQRYYYRVQAIGAGTKLTETGYAVSTTQAFMKNPFQVRMRSAPSALEQSGTAGDYVVERCGAGTFVTCSAVPVINSASTWGGETTFTVASGLVNSNAGSVYGNNTNAYLAWSAEL